MAEFTIPKNADFSFTVDVKEPDSFQAQDLTNLNTCIFKVFEAETLNTIITEAPVVTDAINGRMVINLLAADTNLLDVWQSHIAFGSFLKSKYHATLEMTFTDGTLPVSVYISHVVV